MLNMSKKNGRRLSEFSALKRVAFGHYPKQWKNMFDVREIR